MAAPSKPGPLWGQAIAETLWGRRGVAKVIHSCMPLGVAASLSASVHPQQLWLVCLRVLTAAICWSQAAILANDLVDRNADAAAGKRRWVCRLPRGWAAMLVVAVAGAGTMVLLGVGAGDGPVAAYGAATALAFLYSVGPVRLKERGLAGPFAYAAAAGLAYGILPCAWLRVNWSVFAAVAPAVLLDKWVNLQFHQVVDYAADRERSTRTFAVAVGPERARRALHWMAVLAAAWLLGAMAFAVLRLATWKAITACCCGASVLAAATYAKAVEQRAGGEAMLLRELPWTYLASTFAAFRVLPLVLFARLAVLNGPIWICSAAVLALVALDSWHMLRYRYE